MAIVIALCLVGIMAVYSVDPLREEGWSMKSFYGRQVIWNIIGWSIFFLFAFLDYHFLTRTGWFFYLLMLLSLGGVLLFGRGDEAGARRWLFAQSVQPAEFAKIFLVLFLGFYLGEHHEEIDSYALLFKSGFLSLLPVLLVFAEPDLGTSLVLLVVWLGALFFCSFGGRKIGMVFLGLGVLGSLGWLFLKDYQKKRILAFFDPWRDPLGSGYNVLQSQIAIGAGGIAGQGWLSGKQSQLRFLPARHTDFIFASFCEQTGFLGGALVLFLLGMFVWISVRIARDAPDLEGKLLASLVGVVFAFQVLVNVGMNMGVMPVTGIPLPFISYGGSALLVNLAMVGLLYNIANSRKKKNGRDKLEWPYQQ